QILDIQGNEALLITNEIVNLRAYDELTEKQEELYSDDNYEYNPDDFSTTWEDCSLRKWLNEEFFSSAFNEDEQSSILTTQVVTEDNDYEGIVDDYGRATPGGEDTDDEVFLLSFDEVQNAAYGFDADRTVYDVARQAKATEYAKDAGVYVDRDNAPWLLRSPGESNSYTGYVDYDGYVSFWGTEIDPEYYGYGVRPALNLDLSKVVLVSESASGGAPYTVIPKESIVAPTITTTSLAGGRNGASYSAAPEVTADARFELTWSVADGSLPPGLELDESTGAITGMPSAAGNYSFTLQAANAGGAATQAYTLAIAEGYTPVSTVTVTVDSRGVESDISQTTYTVIAGATLARPANPTSSTHDFGGWYADANFLTPFDFSGPITANVTLYAKWELKTSAGENAGSGGEQNPGIDNGSSGGTSGGASGNASGGSGGANSGSTTTGGATGGSTGGSGGATFTSTSGNGGGNNAAADTGTEIGDTDTPLSDVPGTTSDAGDNGSKGASPSTDTRINPSDTPLAGGDVDGQKGNDSVLGTILPIAGAAIAALLIALLAFYLLRRKKEKGEA
ncbi:MAG: DUF6273 domain-containing protein, partial [Clostridiales Family XIII bacterium]|nr:DUF6273 domain-containing protein [Clostridiales Family XIII bacterium]